MFLIFLFLMPYFICDYISIYFTECSYNSRIKSFEWDKPIITTLVYLTQGWHLWDLVTFFCFFICWEFWIIYLTCKYYTVETLKSVIYSKECLYLLVSICLYTNSPRLGKQQHLKVLEGIVPIAHAGIKIVPFLISQNGKTYNLWDNY